jgi:hypothetical protein
LVIVFLRARDLPGGGQGLHGVVVTGMENDGIVVLDPQPGNRYVIAQKTFVSAWQALDTQGMVIWR